MEAKTLPLTGGRSCTGLMTALLTAVLLAAALLAAPASCRFGQPLILPPTELATHSKLAALVGEAGGRPGTTVFLTMGDAKYSPQMGDARRGLGPSDLLVVLCLDAACMPLCTAVAVTRWRTTRCFDGFVGTSVGEAKLSGVRQLVEDGFHVVLFDLDVFFFQPPLPHLVPPTVPFWDLQAQQENPDDPLTLNLGFVYTRASPLTARMWAAAEASFLAGKAAGKEVWDQSTVNEVALRMERAEGLHITRLPLNTFTAFTYMNFAQMYDSPDPASALHGWGTVLTHLTCVEGYNSVKDQLQRVFGLSSDEAYYCSAAQRFLQKSTPWAGTLDELQRAVAAAVAHVQQFAAGERPTLLAPKYVNVSFPDADPPTSALLPFFRVFNVARLAQAGLNLVEWNFGANRLRVCSAQVPLLERVVASVAFDETKPASVDSMLCQHVQQVRHNITQHESPTWFCLAFCI